MGYYGHKPAAGENNSFKILDDLSSYTLTFDGTSSAVVSAANDTLNFNNHRFVQGQRVTYTNGGAANIGGLTTGSVYYIIKHDNNHIKLATSASNASSSTAINLTAVAGSGTSHTLNVAFDGTNTKFKITHSSGVKGNVTRAAQLILSVNGVIQQGHDTPTPSSGYGIDSDSTIVFETAPSVGYNFWGNIVANNFASFEITDNKIDVFTGDGTTKNFSLSKTPTNNENVLVTLDGVVQYPSDSTTTRAYSVVGNSLEFSGAPAAAVDIQARHIGFAGGSGGSSGGVTGFYGRTGNVVLKNTDDIVAESAVIGAGVTIHANGAHVTGVVTATSFVGALTGNADTSTTAGTVTTAAQTNITSLGTLTSLNVSGNTSIGGVLTYEDVTNVDSIGVVTARSGIRIGAGGTIGPSTGAGIVTYFGDGSNLTGISGGVDSDDQRNTKAGDNAGDSFDGTNATDNTLIGYDAGTAITTGDKNTLVGSYAGDSLTTSSNVTAIGYYAASTISTQSAFTGVTAVGSNACKTSTGQRNTAVGFDALKNGSSAAYNCILGNEAARDSDGSSNVIIGDSALLYGTSSASHNVAIGRNAFVGHNSNCVSDHSVSIGYESLYNTGRTTARANIAIGSSAGKTITTGRNNIIIGDSANATSATTNNEITLGNSSTTKFRIPGLDYYNDEGKIGIGTDNPAEEFHLYGDSAVVALIESVGANDSRVRIKAPSDRISYLEFADDDADAGEIRYDHDDNYMGFHVNNNQERLRIDSTGDVRFAGTNLTNSTNKNVNLTAPSWNTGEEDVNLIQVENEETSNQISFGGGTSGLNAATSLRFLTASAINTTTGTERLRIKSDGQIVKNQGANVTSLKTYNSNADSFTLDHYQYQVSSTYQRYTDIVSIGDGTWGSNIRFFTNANGSANGIERLRITSAGAMNVANQPSFSITTTNTNTFGTSGSHYALSYASPIPIFTSGETTTEHHVGSVLTYHDYVAGSNTGRFVKFTAPVAGNYLFGINAECSVAADDWVGFGFEINNTGTHNTTLERLVAWTHNQSAEDATAQARRRSFQASCLIRLAKDDTIVPYQQSSGTSSMSNTFRVWGMLVN